MAKKTLYLQRLKFIKLSFDTKEIINLLLINNQNHMQILFFSLAGNQMHLTIVQLKSSRWIREQECWKNELQLHFFYKLQFRKPGCDCRSGSAHSVHLENSLGYLFMVSGNVHISVKALKLLAIQKGFFLEHNILQNTTPPLESLVERR